MAAGESENTGHSGRIAYRQSRGAIAHWACLLAVILNEAKDASQLLAVTQIREILRSAQNDTLPVLAMYRTHDCNFLRKSDIGKQVALAGWVNVTRDHGGVIFIDLRDREGLTQIVFRPEENAELAKQAHTLRGADVIQVSGRVA